MIRSFQRIRSTRSTERDVPFTLLPHGPPLKRFQRLAKAKGSTSIFARTSTRRECGESVTVGRDSRDAADHAAEMQQNRSRMTGQNDNHTRPGTGIFTDQSVGVVDQGSMCMYKYVPYMECPGLILAFLGCLVLHLVG